VRKLVHLSDLHFGRIDHALLEPLRRCVWRLDPNLVVVSGDLTQRARAEQFREARAFLDTLPHPQIVVPGNHDVPLYNVFKRFLKALDDYERYISTDLEPTYIDDEIAVVGINTARSLTFKGGRISEEQVERVRAKLCDLPETVTKIIVTHHPFDLPPHWDDDHIVKRAPLAMQMFSRCGADILLAGHVHMSHAGDTTARYKIEGFAALVVQAGTATSTRGRGELNSFNALRIVPNEVTVERYTWEAQIDDFSMTHSETFKRSARGWIAQASPTGIASSR
jgi:3',5'-cyclic AMP phosphodiesterase CpdA